MNRIAHRILGTVCLQFLPRSNYTKTKRNDRMTLRYQTKYLLQEWESCCSKSKFNNKLNPESKLDSGVERRPGIERIRDCDSLELLHWVSACRNTDDRRTNGTIGDFKTDFNGWEKRLNRMEANTEAILWSFWIIFNLKLHSAGKHPTKELRVFLTDTTAESESTQ